MKIKYVFEKDILVKKKMLLARIERATFRLLGERYSH